MSARSGPLLAEGPYSLSVQCPSCARLVELAFTVSARQDVDRQLATLRVRLTARGRPHHCTIVDPAQLLLVDPEAVPA